MFNVGDMVFVPNAYDWIWRSHLTKIEEISNEDGKMVYYADCPQLNLFSFNSGNQIKRIKFFEKEIFKTKAECDEYISNYYYGGLCKGCHYEDIAGDIWYCNDCSFIEKVKGEKPGDNFKLVCKRNNLDVGGQYVARGHEICKYYDPTLPQNKKTYVSWEHYDDILRNCEFNKECVHHKNSCHKTCSYEWYMNQLVDIPISFKLGDRVVRSARITRRMWIEQNFLNNGILKCKSLDFVPELTKTGRVKKNSVRFISFDKFAEVNINTGEIFALASYD